MEDVRLVFGGVVARSIFTECAMTLPVYGQKNHHVILKSGDVDYNFMVFDIVSHVSL